MGNTAKGSALGLQPTAEAGDPDPNSEEQPVPFFDTTIVLNGATTLLNIQRWNPRFPNLEDKPMAATANLFVATPRQGEVEKKTLFRVHSLILCACWSKILDSVLVTDKQDIPALSPTTIQAPMALGMDTSLAAGCTLEYCYSHDYTPTAKSLLRALAGVELAPNKFVVEPAYCYSSDSASGIPNPGLNPGYQAGMRALPGPIGHPFPSRCPMSTHLFLYGYAMQQEVSGLADLSLHKFVVACLVCFEKRWQSARPRGRISEDERAYQNRVLSDFETCLTLVFDNKAPQPSPRAAPQAAPQAPPQASPPATPKKATRLKTNPRRSHESPRSRHRAHGNGVLLSIKDTLLGQHPPQDEAGSRKNADKVGLTDFSTARPAVMAIIRALFLRNHAGLHSERPDFRSVAKGLKCETHVFDEAKLSQGKWDKEVERLIQAAENNPHLLKLGYDSALTLGPQEANIISLDEGTATASPSSGAPENQAGKAGPSEANYGELEFLNSIQPGVAQNEPSYPQIDGGKHVRRSSSGSGEQRYASASRAASSRSVDMVPTSHQEPAKSRRITTLRAPPNKLRAILLTQTSDHEGDEDHEYGNDESDDDESDDDESDDEESDDEESDDEEDDED
ncbi:hypothetical protein MKZ38_000302 [Zalerion maritima]|uniref:Uncharacterized protein n=1 Tax=Zalerion maritima TaxID=339359 RepID=A0AAD5RT27_9PEZI|nr:hypothetical protein MKZ38_000302 [Zalerion maritima]